jgi:ubiquinone/menaquinone biosynthesis C-methylase UbiE
VAAAGELWGGAEYELIAARLAPIHDRLVASLAPRVGERLLDVATGTGEVALRAARLGAEVTGVDISEGMLDAARTAAGREDTSATFELGDAQKLRFGDASFDVVSSSFGCIFAPDKEATARELARVCRPGGRLGLTAWCPNPELSALYARFTNPESQNPEDWGVPTTVERLLGAAFELDVEPGEWVVEGGSGEELWLLWLRAVPPFKALAESLDPERREELHRATVDFYEAHRGPGGIRHVRPYLLVTGKRRP